MRRRGHSCCAPAVGNLHQKRMEKNYAARIYRREVAKASANRDRLADLERKLRNAAKACEAAELEYEAHRAEHHGVTS